MVSLNFNASQHEPMNGGFEPLPAGQYLACITGSQMKDTKRRDGRYLELEIEIIDGQCKGRKVWDRLNLENKNQEAVAIAQGRLSAICHAVNVMEAQDSSQLHNIPMLVKVKQTKRPDTGDVSNDVVAYFNHKDKMAELQGTPPNRAPYAHDDAPF